jgi:hypothetical protein
VPHPKVKGPALGSDAWFENATAELTKQAQVQPGLVKSETVEYEGAFPGRQFDITFGPTTRIVRLYVIKDRVYYLAAEGPGITITEPEVERFFDSFQVPDAAK